jgi:sialate O-acetylesterase
MIAPLLNFNIKGVVWYQGESNERNPQEYGSKLQTMINDWRSKWDQGNFPFIYVQLPNYRQETPFPSESSWAELRQSQLNTLKIENTGMAVTIDLGEWNDVHPLDKEDVGKRLVLLARKLAYHENEVAAFSPVPDHAGFEEEKVMITFRNAGNGLKTKDGGPVQYFAISGDGRYFIWAKAMINGNVVTVWNDKIKNPVKVRYAWADNPDTANLISKDGLPASPFEIDRRSDDSH